MLLFPLFMPKIVKHVLHYFQESKVTIYNTNKKQEFLLKKNNN